MFPLSSLLRNGFGVYGWVGLLSLALSEVALGSSPNLTLMAPAKQGERAIDTLTLDGRYDRPQLLVWQTLESGEQTQVAAPLEWETEDASIVVVQPSGRLIPKGDGTTRVIGRLGQRAVELRVAIQDFDLEPETHFANAVVPIFTKAGCNGGGCHGKSGGQNGFRLSLLGFEPEKDYEWIVKEARGRRVTPAAPEQSLLLLKATAAAPHGGGRRIEPDSEDYETLTRWIRQGLPIGASDAPVVDHISVFPNDETVAADSKQRVVVVAEYTDGKRVDITRSALLESNRPELAEVSADGQIHFGTTPGDVAIMVRYQGNVAVYRAMIPLGAPIANLPEPSNYIDQHVFAKLRRVGMPPSEPADDSVFLRRATLDIAGRLPTLEETDQFLSSGAPNKRRDWVDTLLDSRDYAEHFASKWSALLRNKRERDQQKPGSYAFHTWIRDQLNTNVPYDEFVSRILTASGDIESNPPVAWYRQVDETTEALEDTAQLFLGTRIQCAQCHHHPFEKWSQRDYYQFSAFFSRIGRESGSRPDEERIFHKYGQATAQNQADGQKVFPAGLGGEILDDLSPSADPREELANWLRRKENPFFAKSLVNRYWKHFMGDWAGGTRRRSARDQSTDKS